MEKNIIVCENDRYGIDLEKIIECGDKDLQISIIEFLYGTCKIEYLCFLQYFKKSKFPEVRVKITEYAGELTLTEFLSDPDSNVRAAAIEKLTEKIIKDTIEDGEMEELLDDFIDDLDDIIDSTPIDRYCSYYYSYRLEISSRMLILTKLYKANDRWESNDFITKEEFTQYINRTIGYFDDEDTLIYILSELLGTSTNSIIDKSINESLAQALLNGKIRIK